MSFDSLPDRVIIQIALELDMTELLLLCKTSDRINNLICNNPEYFKTERIYENILSDPNIAMIDKIALNAQQKWPVPGFALAVVKDGHTVLSKGYGVKEIGKNDPVDENTLFSVASITKGFTAAIIAMLVEEGKIKWDDLVRDYLPWFQLYDPHVSKIITIRDLLSHRTGLKTFSGDLLWFKTNYLPEEIIYRARFLPESHPFRTTFGYSNLMYIALGEIIHKITGKTWNDFVQERIIQPLNMNNTVTSINDLYQKNVATPHKNLADKVVPIEWSNWDSMASAGGIISSVKDIANWMNLQINRGTYTDIEFFTKKSSDEMWTVNTPFDLSDFQRSIGITYKGYGLGWFVQDYHGKIMISHAGGYEGMQGLMILVPEEKLGIVVLTNAMTNIETQIAYSIMDLYLGQRDTDWEKLMLNPYIDNLQKFKESQDRLLEEKDPDNNLLNPEKYIGTYGGKMYGNVTVTLENGGLVLRFLPAPDVVADLTYIHDDKIRSNSKSQEYIFVVEFRKTYAFFGNGKAIFISDDINNIIEMKLDIPNNDLWFDELKLERI